MIKKSLKVLFFLFITFVFVFSSYELFFHKAEAAWLNCDWNTECTRAGDNCSGTVTCACIYLYTNQFACSIGIIPEQ